MRTLKNKHKHVRSTTYIHVAGLAQCNALSVPIRNIQTFYNVCQLPKSQLFGLDFPP